jgi:glycosyltransferase involved in cell wall biosynthesis
MVTDKIEGCPPVSVIVCTLNEEQNLTHVLPRIPSWVEEIIIVDGHSSDRTVEVARGICPEIKVLYQPGRGKGDAIQHGVSNASGDIIVTLDADGSTNPEDIPKFITLLTQGYDLVKGTRLTQGRPPNMPRHRWLGNWVLVKTCNILIGTRYTDVCSGYNVFWKSAFQRLKLVNTGFEMEQEMMVKAKKTGLKIIEVEHEDAGRLGSDSKVAGVKQGFIDLWTIVKECFR